MKKYLFIVSFVGLLFCSQFKTNAQSWQPLGPNDYDQASNTMVQSPRITFDQTGVPYISYSDAQTNNITVKKYTGSKWVLVGPANFSTGGVSNPSIVFNGNIPYVVFSDLANGSKATVKKFDGTNWVNVGTAGLSAAEAFTNSLRFDNGVPFLAYQNGVDGSATVKKFDGTNWINVGPEAISVQKASSISLTFNNSIPYIAYQDNNGAVVKKFDGTNWIAVGSTFSTGLAKFITIAFNNNIPYVSYQDFASSKATVKKFDGTNWTAVGTERFSSGDAMFIKLVINNSDLYVIYGAIVQKFNGTSWVNAGSTNITTGSNQDDSSLAFDNNGVPYTIIGDRSNDSKATVKKLEANNWVNVASPAGFSNGPVGSVSLVINNSIPYVAYQDGANSSKSTVKKYDGSNWVNLGNAGFSGGIANTISLAFSGITPYVVYGDVSNGSKATVMKFDGTNWVTVGTAGFSSGTASGTSIAFDGTTPYVAYGDSGNGNKITVKKFDGTSWITIGAAGFSAGSIGTNSIYIDSGIPYVSFDDASNAGKATVMKFDGSSWIPVGTIGFTAGKATKTTLKFHNNIPYISFIDDAKASKATVMKFDGTNWTIVGTAGFSPDVAANLSFDYSGNTPYIAFEDGISSNSKAVVMKFDGTSWVSLGSDDISAGGVSTLSLASNGTNVYIVYNSSGLYSKLFNDVVTSPTTQATSISFTNKTATGTTINWINGSGTSRAVFMLSGTNGNPIPADATTYIPNTTFGSGSQIGSTGWYCIYNGPGSSVPVTGLTTSSAYRVMVVEYNGATGLEKYLTTSSSGNPVNTSGNAAISKLDLSTGVLSPSFDPDVTSYTTSVPGTVNSVTLTPLATYEGSTIKVNGQLVTSGTPSGTIPLNTGSNTVTTIVTLADGVTQNTYVITINKVSDQHIIFMPLETKTYGDSGFILNATSDNTTVPITFTSDNQLVATIKFGNILSIVGAGTANITASQAGTGNTATQLLTANKAKLAVFASNTTKVYGTPNPVFAINYIKPVTGDIREFTTPGTAATLATVTSPVGNYDITVNGVTADNYIISYINATLTITPADRFITSFNALPDKTYGDADFQPGATLNSGEQAIYTSSNASVATIVNSMIHITGAGTVIITATAPDNANYKTTVPVSQTLVIKKANQTITFQPIPDQLRGSSYDLSAVISSAGLPVTFTIDDKIIASIQDKNLRSLAIGKTSITAMSVGDNNYNAATPITQPLNINGTEGQSVVVHQAMSPNGDGINDFLYIEGIKEHPDNKVTIISRSGTKLFEITNYNNASRVFDGHSNITGNMLQPGSYYYLIQLSDGNKTSRVTGYFVLKY